MKLTKTLALTALFAGGLIAGSIALQAQDAPKDKPAPPPQAAPGQHARPDFLKDLNLTDDQKAKFKEIMQGRMEKMKALREDATLSVPDKQAKAKALMEDTNKQLKELLTEEQFAKWQKMSMGMGHQRPGAGGPPPAGGGDKPAK